MLMEPNGTADDGAVIKSDKIRMEIKPFAV